MLQRHIIFAASLISLACVSSAFAAKPIDLSHQPIAALHALTAAGPASVKQISSDVDSRQTTHIRVQQMYAGYPVFGGDAVVHIPQGGANASLRSVGASTTMNGIFYQELNADLHGAPPVAQADAVTKHAVGLYQKQSGNKHDVANKAAELMVFVDENNKAHWVFLVSFIPQSTGKPVKPTYLIDAQTSQVYAQWDDIKTLDSTTGGGFGGNEKIGQVSYDGLVGHMPQLSIMRNAGTNLCYLQNEDVTVLDGRYKDNVATFSCQQMASEHNNEYWDADFDHVNGGYSPANDALFFGKVVKDMYKNWYHDAVLMEDGRPMQLTMRVHAPDPQTGAPAYENAYWDGKQMSFGDGQHLFYPLVSLGVAAHEISHGFTEQHSNLWY